MQRPQALTSLPPEQGCFQHPGCHMAMTLEQRLCVRLVCSV